MTASIVFTLLSLLCQALYIVASMPEIWDEMLRREIERGVSPDQARISCGWRRMELAGFALLFMALGAFA